jgi:hypothetical protein
MDAFDPKTSIHEMTFLDGSEDLIVTTLTALLRLDPFAKRVLQKRPLKLGCHVVTPDGRLLVGEGNKVFEWELADLKRGAQVSFPAQRGNDGKFAELACSPDGKRLAAITRGGEVMIRTFGDGAVVTIAGPTGDGRSNIRFMRADALGSVRAGSYVQVLGLDSRSGPTIVASHSDYRDRHLVIARSDATVRLISESEKTIATCDLDGDVRAVRFVPGQPWIVARSETTLYVLDDKLKLMNHAALPAGTDTIHVAPNRLAAIVFQKAIHWFDLPALSSSPNLAKQLDRERAAAAKAAVTEKTARQAWIADQDAKKAAAVARAAKARPSAYRAKIQGVIDRLRAIPGITVTAELGANATPAAIAKAEAKLGSLPAAMRARWAEVDGFSIEWSGHGSGGLVGVFGLAKLVSTSSEDELWNDEFDDDRPKGYLSLAALKRARVLWSLPGREESVGIVLGKRPMLCFGAPNSVQELAVDLETYLGVMLGTAGILQIHDALLGTTTARAKARRRVDADLAKALPGWPRVAWPSSRA